MEMFVKTRRLYLRNLRQADADIMYAYRNDPDCARFQRWEDTSMTAIRKLIDTFRDCVFLSDQEEQHYAVCTCDGTFAGDLTYFYTETDACVTLGITMAPEHQRRGIAREMLASVISAIQTRHPALDIVALIDPENMPSIALFESLGFYRECYAESIHSYVYVIDGNSQGAHIQ